MCADNALPKRRQCGKRAFLLIAAGRARAGAGAGARTNLTFLLTDRGVPFGSAAGCGTWFKKRCREAGLPHCSMHGLRKLAATRLADAGCSEPEIMAGHRSSSELRRYIEQRNQAKLAEQAFAKGRNSEQKLSSSETPLDKSGENLCKIKAG